LQRAVNDAARRGDVVAVRCRAASVDTVLENLTKYFGRCEEKNSK
jgi:hypothetical protein